VGGETANAGLCVTCEHVRRVMSDRGSVFYLCQLSKVDPSFPKYPRLPVLACAGYERSQDSEASRPIE
jgi:hypothetical protein